MIPPLKLPRILEMHYNNSDIAEDDSALEHLAIGYRKGVASCGKRRKINNFDFVLNWVNHNGEYYVQIGIPTGISPHHSSHYWRNWRQNRKNNEVWEVKWIAQKIVPSSFFAGKRYVLSTKQKHDIYRYLIND
jgi:hypothetical protein